MHFEWDYIKAESNKDKHQGVTFDEGVRYVKQPIARQKIMREEYDLKKLKVKRRGLLPEFKDDKGKQAKVRITISLDRDIVEYFKQSADGVGSLPYQTQINQMLRMAIENNKQGDMETVKLELLKDPDFIRALASQISAARQQ